MKVSVVIPTYNRAQYLRDNYRSLAAQTVNRREYEIIYVDDGSTDGTAALVAEFVADTTGPETRYIKGEHGGPARARNLGTRHAKAPIVAFIDDDCLADNGWLEAVLAGYHANPSAAGVGGKTVTYPEKVTPLTHQIQNDSPTDFPTCNVSYTKATLTAIGGYDEQFPFTGEDADIHWRAETVGPVVHNPDMLVIHPPRPISFWKDLRVMGYLDAEFRLYEKMPGAYRKRRKHPLVELIWFHLMKLTIKRFLKALPWLLKNPFIFFEATALLVLQRLYLVVLIPYFTVRHLAKTGYRTQQES